MGRIVVLPVDEDDGMGFGSVDADTNGVPPSTAVVPAPGSVSIDTRSPPSEFADEHQPLMLLALNSTDAVSWEESQKRVRGFLKSRRIENCA